MDETDKIAKELEDLMVRYGLPMMTVAYHDGIKQLHVRRICLNETYQMFAHMLTQHVSQSVGEIKKYMDTIVEIVR